MGQVSIITACYNSEKYIEDTIRSVQAQTYDNWEMIIIDDCSTDQSRDIVERYQGNDSRIKLLQTERNGGQSIARNMGVKIAKGQYLTYLDSDDLWDSEFLAKATSFMQEKNAELITTGYRRRTHDLAINLSDAVIPPTISYETTLKTCHFTCLTTMYDMSKIGKHYMLKIKKRSDLALWLEILKNIKHAYGLDEVLATYRIHGGSLSRNKFSAASFQWQVYRDIEKLNLIQASYYFLHYTIRGLLKNYTILRPKANMN
ncbi:glycosyltransferase family 2 protein [Planctomycetota bacterium]|nr:glycosyltransferase family 2 protein [Planctomycetota bacterium]